MALPGGIFRTQQQCQVNSESLENSSQTATGTDSWFGKQPNQYQPPHGYGYPPLQQRCPGAPQVYQHSPFHRTYSSESTTSAWQGYPSDGPPWQGCDLHEGGFVQSQMFPHRRFCGQWPSSPRTSGLHQGTPETHPVNRPTSSNSNPYPEHHSATSRRPPIILPTKEFQPPAEPRKTDVSVIAEWPQLLEMSYNDYDADDESDNSPDLGITDDKQPVSLK